MFKNLLIQRDEISKDFMKFYQSRNFIIHDQLPLKIEFDPTLSFTSCSICVFKKYETENTICMDYITVQNCLRTNTYLISQQIDEDLLWTSSLTMMGGYKKVTNENAKRLFQEQLILQGVFLKRWIKQSQEIILTIPKVLLDINYVDEDTVELLEKYKISVCLEDDINGDLEWKYGLNHLQGHGTRWEIKGEKTYNFGNVILIFKENEPIGIDFGGGLEILIQARNELAHKIMANDFCTDYIFQKSFESNSMIKLIDATNTLLTILLETEFLSQSSIRIDYVVYQYVKVFKSLVIYLEVSESQIYILIEELLKSKNINNENLDDVYTEKIYNEFVEKFSSYWNVNHYYQNSKTFKKRDFEQKKYEDLIVKLINKRKISSSKLLWGL